MSEEVLEKEVFNFETIKTFEDACNKLGIDPVEFEQKYSNLKKCDLAFGKLQIIYEAINDGWEADYSNENEYKYYPYFRWNEISGFSFLASDCNRSLSDVGSLLSTNSEEKSEYIGEQFIDIYNDFLKK
jgi:hypothetical protein